MNTKTSADNVTLAESLDQLQVSFGQAAGKPREMPTTSRLIAATADLKKEEAELELCEQVEAELADADEKISQAVATFDASQAALDAVIARNGSDDDQRSALASMRSAQDSVDIAKRRRKLIADRCRVEEQRKRVNLARERYDQAKAEDRSARTRFILDVFYDDVLVVARAASLRAHAALDCVPRELETSIDVLSGLVHGKVAYDQLVARYLKAPDRVNG